MSVAISGVGTRDAFGPRMSLPPTRSALRRTRTRRSSRSGRRRVAHAGYELGEHRDRADRARGAAADAQREADEGEAAFAHHGLEIPQALDMRDAALRAGKVRLVVRLALRRRAHRLDAEDRRALVGEPVHAVDVQARKVGRVA